MERTQWVDAGFQDAVRCSWSLAVWNLKFTSRLNRKGWRIGLWRGPHDVESSLSGLNRKYNKKNRTMSVWSGAVCGWAVALTVNGSETASWWECLQGCLPVEFSSFWQCSSCEDMDYDAASEFLLPWSFVFSLLTLGFMNCCIGTNWLKFWVLNHCGI